MKTKKKEKELLDNEELIFAISKGLPLYKSDYSEFELSKLKEKALCTKFHREKQIENRKKKGN